MVFRDARVGKRHYKAETRHMRPKEFSHLIHEDALPILPSSKAFEVNQGNVHYIRRQWSLTLAYGLTVQQGVTTYRTAL